MAKQIARLLKTDIMADLDMPGLAQLLESKGRKGDTMLAHITPQEAALLKARGGAGTMNPDTGLPEFYKGDFDISQYAGEPDIATGGYTKTASVPSPEFEMRSLPASQQFPLSDADLGQMYSAAPAPSQYSLLPQNAVPNPRTGGYVSPETADVGGQFGVGFGQPSRVNLRVPTGDIGLRMTPQAAAAIPPVPSMPFRQTTIPEVTQALQREPSLAERAKSYITSERGLEKLGLAGLATIPGILASQRAGEQGQAAKRELQQLAAPYTERGRRLIQQAETGELSATEQQQIAAMQARLQQGVAGRGGVGAEQSAAQVEAFRQQLLSQKYDLGLKVANIGDQIAAGAIKTGLEADRYVNELTTNYFTNMAAILGGAPNQPFRRSE